MRYFGLGCRAMFIGFALSFAICASLIPAKAADMSANRQSSAAYVGAGSAETKSFYRGEPDLKHTTINKNGTMVTHQAAGLKPEILSRTLVCNLPDGDSERPSVYKLNVGGVYEIDTRGEFFVVNIHDHKGKHVEQLWSIQNCTARTVYEPITQEQINEQHNRFYQHSK